MRKGFEISKVLKEVEDSKNGRTAKALFLANALAYNVRLDLTIPVDTIINDAMKEAKSVISAVNENIPVDTKSCIELFKQGIRIRYELLNQVTDPTLIQLVATSKTAEENQTPEETVKTMAIVNYSNFPKVQREISALLNMEL